MRKQVLAAAFVVVAQAIPAAAPPPITELERQRLVAHMQMTASWLEDEVSRVSAAQAAFRPSATSWTILEVLDHLVVVGPIYRQDLQDAKPVADRAGMMNDIDVLCTASIGPSAKPRSRPRSRRARCGTCRVG